MHNNIGGKAMGSGSWSSDTYDRVTRHKIDSGRTFSYTADAFRSGKVEAHESLDVKGPKIRESRDSDEHPESTPIIIGFDVTGSMGGNPGIIQKSLKELFGMLVRRDIVPDPQIAISAYGDMYCDKVPIQFGQFESDNKIDDELDNILIEKGGGANMGETSAIIPYYAAKYVKTDAWDKRHKKGYIFLIGDECALSMESNMFKKFLGETDVSDISAEDAYAMAQEKWDIYFLLINNSSARWQESEEKYSNILGKDHVMILQDTRGVSATIASIIALKEETVSKESLGTELAAAGFDSTAINAAKNAVSVVGSTGGTNVNINTEYADLNL